MGPYQANGSVSGLWNRVRSVDAYKVHGAVSDSWSHTRTMGPCQDCETVLGSLASTRPESACQAHGTVSDSCVPYQAGWSGWVLNVTYLCFQKLSVRSLDEVKPQIYHVFKSKSTDT